MHLVEKRILGLGWTLEPKDEPMEPRGFRAPPPRCCYEEDLGELLVYATPQGKYRPLAFSKITQVFYLLKLVPGCFKSE
jgi:hypothetical protein